jgi:2,4-dienoyl-CoA reductase-like NADH-dependent reductase (Old Yellow Enzyme family)/NADPH-dependent 2,4-dienoyl-CoA reductase/sulfur reductase-like enzyme
MTLTRIFEPLAIRGVIIPNRIVRTGHLTKLAIGGVSDELIAYHLARARGGVGLSVLEACAVHPSSALAMTSFDDSVIDGYRRLADAVRPHGMRLFQQLWHGGHVYNPPGGGPPRGASDVPSPISGIPPVPLTRDEIGELVEAYAAAARRAVAGGLDGIEVHAGHGYLLHQFLSKLTNNRTDEYGGALVARMRFLVEVLEAVRGAVGEEVPVGVRVGAGQVSGDLGEADVAEVSRRLVELGLVDFLNVTSGDYYRMHQMMGGMDRPAGYMLPSSGAVTAEVRSVPRIVTGRFRTLEEADQVLRDGVADLVSMVRAHIADPDLVAKSRAGRPMSVRPCIGCNQGCIARTSGVDARMACTVNPAVGFESTLDERLIGRTSRPRYVLVVGGGPAGMEAARTARLRGHDVTLWEAAGELGGQLNVARRAPKMQGLDDILEWLRSQVRELGVTVRTSRFAEVADVLAAGPDVVIVATGAEPDLSGRLIAAPGTPVEGVDLPHVLSSVDLLAGAYPVPGSRAVVYDDLGQYEAVAVVEALLARDVDVTALTRHAGFGGYVDAAMRLQPALERFAAYPAQFRVLPWAQPLSITPTDVVVAIAGTGVEKVAADTVVMVTRKTSRRELADLANGVTDVRVVGDALSGRDLQVAIREGHLAGRTIE